jgi:hypothetical protein
MVSTFTSVLRNKLVGNYIKSAYYETIADIIADIYIYIARCGHIPSIITPFECDDVLADIHQQTIEDDR